MTVYDLQASAAELSSAWTSRILGRLGGANLKVLRMDAQPYPDDTHDFDEALLVIEGTMKLAVRGAVLSVDAGQVFIVSAGVPHAVAEGSHGTLVIIDK